MPNIASQPSGEPNPEKPTESAPPTPQLSDHQLPSLSRRVLLSSRAVVGYGLESAGGAVVSSSRAIKEFAVGVGTGAFEFTSRAGPLAHIAIRQAVTALAQDPELPTPLRREILSKIPHLGNPVRFADACAKWHHGENLIAKGHLAEGEKCKATARAECFVPLTDIGLGALLTGVSLASRSARIAIVLGRISDALKVNRFTRFLSKVPDISESAAKKFSETERGKRVADTILRGLKPEWLISIETPPDHAVSPQD